MWDSLLDALVPRNERQRKRKAAGVGGGGGLTDWTEGDCHVWGAVSVSKQSKKYMKVGRASETESRDTAGEAIDVT